MLLIYFYTDLPRTNSGAYSLNLADSQRHPVTVSGVLGSSICEYNISAAKHRSELWWGFQDEVMAKQHVL